MPPPIAHPAAVGLRSAAIPEPASRTSATPDRLVIQSEPNALRDRLELKRGLLAGEARVDPKFFYDPAGCALFDGICGLPEYYLTRTEAAILHERRGEILDRLPPALQWIDLGCGSAGKSRPWLRTAAARRFVGVDIATEWLAAAVEAIAGEFPEIEARGVVTDFVHGLDLHEVIAQRPELPPVFFYPGSSLGNFTADSALALLKSVRGHVSRAGALLIGVDLIKDVRVLEAAYDDAAGMTAAFNRNVLSVVNRLLEADFEPDRFAHQALYNPADRRIEMYLRSEWDQIVTIAGERRAFRRGELILTEYSHKYTVAGFCRLLEAAGFSRIKVWTDADGWFAVCLAEA